MGGALVIGIGVMADFEAPLFKCGKEWPVIKGVHTVQYRGAGIAIEDDVPDIGGIGSRLQCGRGVDDAGRDDFSCFVGRNGLTPA